MKIIQDTIKLKDLNNIDYKYYPKIDNIEITIVPVRKTKRVFYVKDSRLVNRKLGREQIINNEHNANIVAAYLVSNGEFTLVVWMRDDNTNWMDIKFNTNRFGYNNPETTIKVIDER